MPSSEEPRAGIDTPEGRIPFDREDEETLRSVAGWAMAVALISIASVLVNVIIGFVQQGLSGVLTSSVSMVVTALLATFLLGGASSLRKVAATDDADRLYLVDGLRKLRNYFMTAGILFIIVLGLVALVLLAALTCGLVR